jgi:hypothetical protein
MENITLKILLISSDKRVEIEFRNACSKLYDFEVVVFADNSGFDTILCYIKASPLWILAIPTENFLDFIESAPTLTQLIPAGFVILFWTTVDGCFASCELLPNINPHPELLALTQNFCSEVEKG